MYSQVDNEVNGLNWIMKKCLLLKLVNSKYLPVKSMIQCFNSILQNKCVLCKRRFVFFFFIFDSILCHTWMRVEAVKYVKIRLRKMLKKLKTGVCTLWTHTCNINFIIWRINYEIKWKQKNSKFDIAVIVNTSIMMYFAFIFQMDFFFFLFF